MFDPQQLAPLIQRLRSELPNLHHTDGELATLLDKVVAIDGSFFRLAADVDWALHLANPHTRCGFVRLNLAWCLKSGQAAGCSVSGDDGVHEGTAAIDFVQPGQIYLFDCGVVTFKLLSSILSAPSDFVCNLKPQVNFTALQDRAPDRQDIDAGVLSDRVGRLDGSPCRTPPQGLVREVLVTYADRNGQSRTLRLLTSLLHVPAHVIAALYRWRWQIELLFRWLKVHANFRHLTSHSRNGVTLSFYIAIIAQLLISLHTRLPPNRYSLVALGWVAGGLCDVADILPMLQRRYRERQLEKRRLARKRAEKNKLK